MSQCKCGSYAINHHCHGRDGSDPDLCDVCYWRKRAEQQDAEPVAWQYVWPNGDTCTASSKEEIETYAKIANGYAEKTQACPGEIIPLYAHPPRREWVGLKADEIDALNNERINKSLFVDEFVRVIEQKLKEKNHG